MGEICSTADALLFEIASCKVACLQLEHQDGQSPCAKIVASQGVNTWSTFQVPEPWSGSLVAAPILFLSSNPSISKVEVYPTGSWPEFELPKFFNERFAGVRIRNGNEALSLDGTYGKPVKYWSSIRNRATELLNRTAKPGEDFALSEIVHCKSEREKGVPEAINECAERYLIRLLSCSGAAVLVLVGRKALKYWNSLQIDSLPSVPEKNGTEVHSIAGRNRIVVYLAHPSGPEPKLFSYWVSPAAMDRIRIVLSENA